MGRVPNSGSTALPVRFLDHDVRTNILFCSAGVSDVLVENFLPGKLAEYGLDYGSLGSACPGLVYCSITGFGQDGPYSNR